jgi:hypothetical protein
MMNNDEAEARIGALDAWTAGYPRSNTFRQFWQDYRDRDPELYDFLKNSDWNSFIDGVRDALNALGDGMDARGFVYSKDRPYRRINEGPSYGDYRDEVLDDLYARLPADYQVSPAIAAEFDSIKERLHSDEWIGKPRRQQLDWLDHELQGLISRIQTPESAAVVHAYLFEFIDTYGIEGADLDALITQHALRL